MPPRVQGWDPILIISQIVCLQSLHYLTLAILIPPLLALFAEPYALARQGGSANVSMVMDWREMAGRPTISGRAGDNSRGWSGLRGVWSGGKHLGGGSVVQGWEWADGGADPTRGWIIAIAWLITSGVDIFYVYHLIRKPTHVLDFALTLLLNHLILTTYYSSSLPTSPFVWITLGAGAALVVIFAEQLCVKREMAEGLGTIDPAEIEAEEGRPLNADEIEMTPR